MKKKIVWLVVSCLMVLSLVLASCGPAVEEEEEVVTPEEEVVVEEEEEVVVEEEEEVVVEEEEVVAPAPEEPKYGGVLILGASSSPRAFDQAFAPTGGYDDLTEEDLLGLNWLMGPAGSGEADWRHTSLVPPPNFLTGRLAESYEMPDDTTLIFHIRKGVYFHDKPPTNGREMNANDVLFTIERVWDAKKSPGAYQSIFLPRETHIESITAPDKWTVVIKTKPGKLSTVFEAAGEVAKIIPPEAVEKYGDLNDWRNVVGTGPFMLTDFVRDSSATLTRNPNYWMTDPIGPGKGNQLPYLDGVKYIVMPDLSTRMAALRTAKIDHLSGINWEDAEGFKETKPELKYVRYFTTGQAIYMRVDKPELPFYDKRVRQALALAVNQPEIAETYYGGEAEVYNYPTAPVKELQGYWVPFEELPESTQELYQYHPDKAKALLAEAGYPDGFKTEIISLSTEVDLLSIVKAYWADIGVDLTLDVKESAVKTTVGWMKTHKEMFSSSVLSLVPYVFQETRSGNYANYSMVNDPLVDEATSGTWANYFDLDKRFQIVKDITPYLLDQAWFVVLPGVYAYTFWQPWVKNYHGEQGVGLWDSDWARWAWLDQDLKEEMTGRR